MAWAAMAEQVRVRARQDLTFKKVRPEILQEVQAIAKEVVTQDLQTPSQEKACVRL